MRDLMESKVPTTKKPPATVELADEMNSAVQNLEEVIERLTEKLGNSGLLGPSGVGASKDDSSGSRYAQPWLARMDVLRARIDTAARRINELAEVLPV